jgi:hypothetical protein
MIVIKSSVRKASPRRGKATKQMIQWMRSFGDIVRITVESAGTHGAGLLGHVQAGGIEVLDRSSSVTLGHFGR